MPFQLEVCRGVDNTPVVYFVHGLLNGTCTGTWAFNTVDQAQAFINRDGTPTAVHVPLFTWSGRKTKVKDGHSCYVVTCNRIDDNIVADVKAAGDRVMGNQLYISKKTTVTFLMLKYSK